MAASPEFENCDGFECVKVIMDPSKEKAKGMSVEERDKKVEARLEEVRNLIKANPGMPKITENTTEMSRFNVTNAVQPEKAEVVVKNMEGLTNMKGVPFVFLVALKGATDPLSFGDKSDFGNCRTCANRGSYYSRFAVLDRENKLVPLLFASDRDSRAFTTYRENLLKKETEIIGIRVIRHPTKGTTAHLGYSSAVFRKREDADRKDGANKDLVAVESCKHRISRFEHVTVRADLSGCSSISNSRAHDLQERVEVNLGSLEALVARFDKAASSRDENVTSSILLKEMIDALKGSSAWTEQRKTFCDWVKDLLSSISKNSNPRALMVRAILAFGVPFSAIDSVKEMIKAYVKTDYDVKKFRALMIKRQKHENYRQTNPCDLKNDDSAASASSSSSRSSKPTMNWKARNAAKKAKNMFYTKARLVAMNARLREEGWEVWLLTKPSSDFDSSYCSLFELLERGRKFYANIPCNGKFSFGTFFELPVDEETECLFTSKYTDIVRLCVEPRTFSKSNDLVVNEDGQVWVQVNAVVRPPNRNQYWLIFDTDSAVMRKDVSRALKNIYNTLPMFRENFIVPPHVNKAAYWQALDETRRGEDGCDFTVKDWHFPPGAKHSGVLFGRYYNTQVSDDHTRVSHLKFENFWFKATATSRKAFVTQVGSPGPEKENSLA